jgi:DNA-binding SARP family transcriptional activator
LAHHQPLRIQLCGRLAVVLAGVRVESQLPGRQARHLFAYLATNRHRAVDRDELIGILWNEAPPEAAGLALSVLLSKIRHVFGDGSVQGRSALQLALPAARIDLEAARDAIHRAEAAVQQRAWVDAYGPSNLARAVASRGFLVGEDGEWIEGTRREVEQIHIRALESEIVCYLGLGTTERKVAIGVARELTRLAPFRESAYRLLMLALEGDGNVAEALLVYDELSRHLRDELGTSPSTALRELHTRLVQGT